MDAVSSYEDMKLERAVGEFHAGNLFFNRKCTDAMVVSDLFGGLSIVGGFCIEGTISKRATATNRRSLR